jgi:hypothetical protein
MPRNEMRKVLVIRTQMKQYRAPLCERLHGLLHAAGIQLTVAYSDPPPVERGKGDNCELLKEYDLTLCNIQYYLSYLLQTIPQFRGFRSA